MAVAGCADEPPKPVPVVLHVVGDPGEAVEGAAVMVGSEAVALTGADGAARLGLTGDEGQEFELHVRCPAAHRSPTTPLAVRRFDLGAGAPPAEYTVACPRTRHTLVVGVRAENGPDLPILYLGHVVARTDRSGAAHVALDMDANDRAELTIGTLGKENEALHPQNPAAVFDMRDGDDVQVFAVAFTRDEKKAHARRAPRGPVAF